VTKTLLVRSDCDVRVLFIDDGSSDDSWQKICAIAARDQRYRGIRLSRNYGSHIALSAGFANIGDADAVATLACDLQDPPEVVVPVYRQVEKWRRYRLGQAHVARRVVGAGLDQPRLRIADSKTRDAAALALHDRQLPARRSQGSLNASRSFKSTIA
jgi:glycosyltransferase involved in cell wall biosynthesis